MRSGFHTTRWSVILSAGNAEGAAGRDALAQLCRDYWQPVYVFVRRSGHDAESARDLTQEYFARLIEREYLEGVRPGIGKFRSFLLTSVKNFLANHRRDAAALKRGGGVVPISLDGEDAERTYRLQPRDERTPEQAYERQWAQRTIERARKRLGREMHEIGKGQQFEVAAGHLGGGREPWSYDRISETLGVSQDAAKMMVSRLRRRFGRVLRDEISQTVESEADVEAEVRYLLSVLR
jgi:RNA polymerase sigma-70 factor (ECF subfamily)